MISRPAFLKLSIRAIPIGMALLALVVYASLTAYHSQLRWGDLSLFHLSDYPYFNYLADAFLHGQLHLRELPEKTHDLVLANGHYYLYWPPFPAIVLAPFVAVFGLAFSDIFLTLLIGALNVYLTARLFRELRYRGVIELSDFHLLMIVLCFAFGTVHLTMAPLGRVWFTAQLIGYFFVLATYLAAVSLEGRKAFLVAGIAISAAIATRATALRRDAKALHALAGGLAAFLCRPPQH